MNRRIARKVRKRWREAFEQEQRIDSFNHQVGPEGAALREVLSKMPGLDRPVPHPYAGWWPRGKVKHHLKIRSRCKHSQRTCQRAFNRLPRQEQLEWLADVAVLKVMRRPPPENPWQAALDSHKAFQGALMMLFGRPEPEPEPDSEAAA